MDTLEAAQAALRDNPEADLTTLYRVIDDMIATIRNKGCAPFLLLPLLGQGKDEHAAHSVNVAVLCSALGDMVGLNSGQIGALAAAAFLHDLGRITIPPEWTQDHSPLSASDRAVVAQHPLWSGLLLLRHQPTPIPMAVLAARHHAPAVGGETNSYRPDIFHKILALADAYDLARISDKYYWKKHRPDRILCRLINRRGREHDAALVKCLVNCVGFYPVGSLVRLDDGRRALVVKPNPASASRPKVFLFEEPSPAGADSQEEAPPAVLDLAEMNETATGFKRSIASTLDPRPTLATMAAALERKKEFLLDYNL